MTFLIDKEWNGKTVLSYIKNRLKISASALAALKRDEMGITVNGRHVTVRYVLSEGESLSVNDKDSFDDVNETIEPSLLPLEVIFENEELMVINKPADMPTHPSHNHHSDTVANAVAHLYSLRGQPLVFRPMGRLDRNTSGIVVLAKNAISASFLSYARRHGLIRKSYIAILCGHVDCNDGLKTIRTYMKRSADSVIMRCVSDESEEGSMQATTHFRVLYTNDKISLVEAFPETGRTHQLRVHFAHIGHPILGDDIYGQSSSYIARHALHAESLSLPLPYDIEKATKFCAGVPADMQDAFNAITGLDLNNIIERSRQGEI